MSEQPLAQSGVLLNPDPSLRHGVDAFFGSLNTQVIKIDILIGKGKRL